MPSLPTPAASPHPARQRTIRDVLVTGGAGFIGSNFVHRTLATRPEVRIHIVDALTYAANLDNLLDPATLDAPSATATPAPLTDTHPERVTFERLDLAEATLTAEAIARFADRVDDPTTAAIVHFAAESHNDNSLRDPSAFVRANVLGTSHLITAAAEHGIHVHHISTDEVFGDLALDDPARFTVDSPYRPSSPYSASKAASDHLVRAWVRSMGLSATISNCSNNYGPRQHPEKFIPRQITGLIEGHPPRLYGTGDNVRDWIHVDDHNDAVWAILDYGLSGRDYLIGADGERSNRQVAEDLLDIFGRDPEDLVFVADRPGHDRRYAIDPSSMSELGWRPQHTDFRAGLAATVEWYRANPSWWRAARQAAEERYARTNQ